MTNIENQVKFSVPKFIDLMNHYEDFADYKNLPKKSIFLELLRNFDEIKKEFNFETQEREDGCIFELINKF